MKSNSQIVVLIGIVIFISYFAFIPQSMGSSPNILAEKNHPYTDTVKKNKPDGNIKTIIDSLNNLYHRLPVEKVYLHTDKPYYNIGDTLWFKAYVLDGLNLIGSRMSGLLYVELDNDSSQMVRRISIPIKEGLGWAQIPLIKAIFHEGGYTLRAYTNWMQNFGEDYVFSQRFYLGVPAQDAWLVKSAATITRVNDKDQLSVELKLNKADKLTSPVSIKKVEVRIYDQDHYLYKEDLQTGIDGSLKFSHVLKAKSDGSRIRVQLTSLEAADNNKTMQIPLSINRNQNIDLQFLPESGQLVNGLKSTVGFKAVGEDGKSRAVLGAIYDSKGTEVVSFASIYNGMGSFEFTPKPGETYTAKMLKPAIKVFEFPKARAFGTVMHIINNEHDETLSINLAGLNTIATDTAFYLVGTSRGVLYYSKKLNNNDYEVRVDKKLFPSGVSRFTLFKGKTPLNERAAFIDNHDGLNIRIKPDKNIYRKRDSVDFNIVVKDKSGFPVQGSFSLAVTDDSQVRPDTMGNYSINTSLLLNADLKGNIETPGYYINRKNKQAWQALDNLMLTQGWTGYDWKDVFARPKPISFKAEKELIVTGRVSNLGNKPMAQAPVLLSSQKPQFITQTLTDENGIFTFRNLPPIDSGSFFIQASKTDGGKMSYGNVSVYKVKPASIPLTVREPILPWYVNTDSTQLNYVRRVAEKNDEKNLKLTGIVLKEVQIKDKKIIKGTLNRFGPGNADLIFDEEDIKKSATTNLYELFAQKIPGFRVKGARGILFKGRGMAIPSIVFNGYATDIRIDGWPLTVDIDIDVPSPPPDGYTTDDIIVFDPLELTVKVDPNLATNLVENVTSEVITALSEYKLSGIVGVEIAYSRKYTNRVWKGRPHGFDFAVIEITTKNGVGWYRDRPANMTSYRPLPILQPLQFYSPRYKVAPAVIEPDYRSTLYWNPNIITDQNGRSKVSFYASDIMQGYTINIQGTSFDGNNGSLLYNLQEKMKTVKPN